MKIVAILLAVAAIGVMLSLWTNREKRADWRGLRRTYCEPFGDYLPPDREAHGVMAFGGRSFFFVISTAVRSGVYVEKSIPGKYFYPPLFIRWDQIARLQISPRPRGKLTDKDLEALLVLEHLKIRLLIPWRRDFRALIPDHVPVRETNAPQVL